MTWWFTSVRWLTSFWPMKTASNPGVVRAATSAAFMVTTGFWVVPSFTCEVKAVTSSPEASRTWMERSIASSLAGKTTPVSAIFIWHSEEPR